MFAAFGGQPMVILLTTAPLALYTKGIIGVAYLGGVRIRKRPDLSHHTNDAKPPTLIALRNVTVWCPSVRLSRLFPTLIERAAHTRRDSSGGGAACDAASIHFGQTIRKVDVRVLVWCGVLTQQVEQ